MGLLSHALQNQDVSGFKSAQCLWFVIVLLQRIPRQFYAPDRSL